MQINRISYFFANPNAEGANRKIPDICKDLEIRCINILRFVKTLNFKTNWKDEISEPELTGSSGSSSSARSLFNDLDSSN